MWCFWGSLCTQVEQRTCDLSPLDTVGWSITVFCFRCLPTLILSSVWSCLAMFSIFIFTSSFFGFPFDTVPGGLSHFRAPSLKWLLWTKIAHSALQAPSEHGAPVQRDRSRILGSWESWQRGPGTLRAVCHSVWNLTRVYKWKNCWAYVHKDR